MFIQGLGQILWPASMTILLCVNVWRIVWMLARERVQEKKKKKKKKGDDNNEQAEAFKCKKKREKKE